jgi:cysteine synthase B
LLDATSGNTGIAYAMLGAAMGFPVTALHALQRLVERKRILAAYGAEVIWTDPADGSDGAIRKARRRSPPPNPRSYFYADQYGNDNNWRAHYYAPPPTRSGSRPTARSPTSSPRSAPPAPSWAPPAACAS